MPKALAPLTCDHPDCSKIFGRKGDLTRHKNIHLGHKPFQCEYCDKKFAQFSGLKTHENVHNGNKPHICGYDGCTAIFGDPSSCARHRKETHRRVGAYCCPEPYCSSRIKRRSAFAAHLKKHGIDSKNLDLESFAPPLLPSESHKSVGCVVDIASGPCDALPTVAEEFEEHFCGFTGEPLLEETTIYRPPTSMSWSTSSAYSPSLSEVPLEPSSDFVALSIADTVQPIGVELDYWSQISTPYDSAATTPYSEYSKMDAFEDSPSLGLYPDSGLFGFPGQDFSSSFSTSYFPFEAARIVSPEIPLLEFPAMAWVEG